MVTSSASQSQLPRPGTEVQMIEETDMTHKGGNETV